MEEIKRWAKKKRDVQVRVDEEFNNLLEEIRDEQRSEGKKPMSRREITALFIEHFRDGLSEIAKKNGKTKTNNKK